MLWLFLLYRKINHIYFIHIIYRHITFYLKAHRWAVVELGFETQSVSIVCDPCYKLYFTKFTSLKLEKVEIQIKTHTN